MDKLLYKVKLDCPICNKEFEPLKVKYSDLRVDKTDTDFYVKYKNFNPLFYEVFVCPNCGFADFQDRFLEVSNADIDLIKKFISSKWNKKDYNDERDIDKALETFILLFANLKVRNSKNSVIGRTLLRIAWLYRLMKNDIKEKEYLTGAAICYANAYQNEEFPIGKLDEATCLYIVGELYRRAENFTDSLKWFGIGITLPIEKRNSKITEMTREQMDLAKDAMKKLEKESIESNE